MADPRGVPPILVKQLDPDRDRYRCGWFLQCEGVPVADVQHPTVGEVPVCSSCLDFIQGD